MDNQRYPIVYKLWAPVYDRAREPFAARARQHAIELLDLQPGEQVSLCGVGLGPDLPHIYPSELTTARDEPSLSRAHYRDVLLHKCGVK